MGLLGCAEDATVCISVSPGSPGWGGGGAGPSWALLGLRSRTEDTGDGAYFKSSTWPDGVNKRFRMPNMSPGGYLCSLIKSWQQQEVDIISSMSQLGKGVSERSYLA